MGQPIELYLDNNLFGPLGTDDLIKNSCWNKLKILDLSSNQIGEEGGNEIGAKSVLDQFTYTLFQE